MVNMYYIIQISGEKFSPIISEIELGYKFDKKNEMGNIVESGRYKGMPLPYGYGDYHIDSNDKDKLIKVISKIEEFMKKMKKNEEIEVSIQLNVEYEAQCNFEIEQEVLRKITNLNIPFSISCYEKEKI